MKTQYILVIILVLLLILAVKCDADKDTTETNETIYKESKPGTDSKLLEEDKKTVIENFINDEIDNETDLDEVVYHPKSRGLIPDLKQPQHTKNLWKTDLSHPKLDSFGVSTSKFSSDLLTPLKNQFTLNKVNPNYKLDKSSKMEKMTFEDFTDPYPAY